MLATKYPLVFLTSSLLITLTNQPSVAFRVFQNPRLEDYSVLSIFRNVPGANFEGVGNTFLQAVDPEAPFDFSRARQFVSPIKLGGTDGLLADLQLYRNEGWSFQRGRNLKGSFNVQRQYACGLITICRLGKRFGVGGIGSVVELNYRPSRSRRDRDPRPEKDNLFWIQRVITNHPPGQPGVTRRYIDNIIDEKTWANATYPWYGLGRQIELSGYFGDRPYRIDVADFNRNYYWVAELYLAKSDKLNPQKVTIYNGVRWGWRYGFLPDNDNCPTISGSSGGGGCPTTTASRTANPEQLSSLNTNNTSQSSTSIPESTSTFGLLALAAWSAISAIKIKKDKQQ